MSGNYFMLQALKGQGVERMWKITIKICYATWEMCENVADFIKRTSRGIAHI